MNVFHFVENRDELRKISVFRCNFLGFKSGSNGVFMWINPNIDIHFPFRNQFSLETIQWTAEFSQKSGICNIEKRVSLLHHEFCTILCVLFLCWQNRLRHFPWVRRVEISGDMALIYMIVKSSKWIKLSLSKSQNAFAQINTIIVVVIHRSHTLYQILCDGVNKFLMVDRVLSIAYALYMYTDYRIKSSATVSLDE